MNLLIQTSKCIYVILYNEYSFTTLQFLSYYFTVASDMCLKGNIMRFAAILHMKFPVAPLVQCFSNGGICTTGSTLRGN